jgi:hypothetical protein
MIARNRFATIAVAFAVLAGAIPVFAQITRDPGYYPGDFFHWGYKDEKIAPDRWKVSVKIQDHVPGHAPKVAMYRAALFAKYNNFTWMNIIYAEYTMFSGRSYLQRFDLTAVGSNSPSYDTQCEADEKFRSWCKQYDVNRVLLETQNALGMTDQETSAELALIAAKYPHPAPVQPARP